MVTLATVEAQLKQAGCKFGLWGRSELKELCKVLLPGETIRMAVNGQYENGFALLAATDFRVLLVDKKPKYLTLKDVRFDMITELDYAGRMLNATMRLYTPNRELHFTAYNPTRLRRLFEYTQHKVMEIRHHFMMQQFQVQNLSRNTPPGVAWALQRGQQSYALDGADTSAAEPQPQLPDAQYQALPETSAAPAHLYNDASDEQRKLAAAMGAAGLTSIVHNGRVIKDYMAVPFTQRWRKRPYGYSRANLGQQQPTLQG